MACSNISIPTKTILLSSKSWIKTFGLPICGFWRCFTFRRHHQFKFRGGDFWAYKLLKLYADWPSHHSCGSLGLLCTVYFLVLVTWIIVQVGGVNQKADIGLYIVLYVVCRFPVYFCFQASLICTLKKIFRPNI